MGQDETLDEQEGRLDDEEADLEKSKDRRRTQREWDRQTAGQDALDDESDDEEMAEAIGVKPQPGVDFPRRRGIMDSINPHAPQDDSGAGTPIDDDARSLDDGMDEDEDEAAISAASTRGPALGLDGAADGASNGDAEGLEALVALKGNSGVSAAGTTNGHKSNGIAEAGEEGHKQPKLEEDTTEPSLLPQPATTTDGQQGGDMEIDEPSAGALSQATAQSSAPGEGAGSAAKTEEMEIEVQAERDAGRSERREEDEAGEAATEIAEGNLPAA